MIRDVAEADFEQAVVERSREVPVVVDFWAEWCGPCRQLGPLLEKEAAAREGRVDLAKIDTDANPGIAEAFGIRGIPAVKAFRDGEIVSEFVGAIPGPRVAAFFDSLVPSEADELASSGDEEALRKALELDPQHEKAGPALARLLVRRGDLDEAAEIAERFPFDFLAIGVAARVALTRADAGFGDIFAAVDAGDYERALDALQEALVERPDAERRDLIRRVMVGIFEELGTGDPLAQQHRRRLASLLH